MTNQDLIKQYVDTGLAIPEYQYSKLSPNLKKTYLRKRMIAYGEQPWSHTELKIYEIKELPVHIKKQFAEKRFEEGYILSDDLFESMSDDMKRRYIEVWIERKEMYFFEIQFQFMSDEQKKRYAKYQLEKKDFLPDFVFEYLSNDEKNQYLEQRIEEGKYLPIAQYETLSDDQKRRYLDKAKKAIQ